jgi:hypothetical protein
MLKLALHDSLITIAMTDSGVHTSLLCIARSDGVLPDVRRYGAVRWHTRASQNECTLNCLWS